MRVLHLAIAASFLSGAAAAACSEGRLELRGDWGTARFRVEIADTPDRIVLGFDRELNAATLNASTFVLEAVGHDSSVLEGLTAEVAVGNPSTAVISLDGLRLASDTYRLRLADDSGVAIEDLSGNPLEGRAEVTFSITTGRAESD